jgi:high-affinity K+ transport system ATPase subunit B
MLVSRQVCPLVGGEHAFGFARPVALRNVKWTPVAASPWVDWWRRHLTVGRAGLIIPIVMVNAIYLTTTTQFTSNGR